VADKSLTAEPTVVTTDGGSVTLLELTALRARLASLQGEADAKGGQAKSLQDLALDRWHQLGELLVASRDRWSPEPSVAQLVQQADLLQQQLREDASAIETMNARDHRGFAGALNRVGDWNRGRGLSAQRAALEAQLIPILVQIGRQAGEGTLPDADTLRAQADAADGEAAKLNAEAAAARVATNALTGEVKQRSDSEHELGFDGPYLAAYLQTYGPAPIQSPLILKKGEQANLATPATLARRQTRRQWVGGSQGFSFPIGHTGIRYRVGSFHGHPIQQQFLGKMDTGTLVVTNQRVAFIGRVKSTSVALAKVMHVECYSDAVAVFQEGRENPDYYLTDQPKYVLFMLNWALGRLDR
jgi:hypothetical protein